MADLVTFTPGLRKSLSSIMALCYAQPPTLSSMMALCYAQPPTLSSIMALCYAQPRLQVLKLMK